MSAQFKQVIESIEHLSADERALIAHCLIASLETQHDEAVESSWAKLVDERYEELSNGKTQGLSWKQIKDAASADD